MVLEAERIRGFWYLSALIFINYSQSEGIDLKVDYLYGDEGKSFGDSFVEEQFYSCFGVSLDLDQIVEFVESVYVGVFEHVNRQKHSSFFFLHLNLTFSLFYLWFSFLLAVCLFKLNRLRFLMFELTYDFDVKLIEKMLWHFFALERALNSYLFSLSFHHLPNPHLSYVTHCQKVIFFLSEQAGEMEEKVIDIFEQIFTGRGHGIIVEPGMTDAVIQIGMQDAIKRHSFFESEINIVVAN